MLGPKTQKTNMFTPAKGFTFNMPTSAGPSMPSKRPILPRKATPVVVGATRAAGLLWRTSNTGKGAAVASAGR